MQSWSGVGEMEGRDVGKTNGDVTTGVPWAVGSTVGVTGEGVSVLRPGSIPITPGVGENGGEEMTDGARLNCQPSLSITTPSAIIPIPDKDIINNRFMPLILTRLPGKRYWVSSWCFPTIISRM